MTLRQRSTNAARVCEFSPCRQWRYTLWRSWVVEDMLVGECSAETRAHEFLMVIGLNPSTADETQDDPTIRRCIGFAKRWGFGALCMTNLFAWRDTDPRGMKAAVDPVGADNDHWLGEVASGAGLILAAWGAHGMHGRRAEIVRHFMPKQLHCLTVNADGSPKHPLYCRSDLQPIAFPAETHAQEPDL